MSEHEIEPIRGLPGLPPAGERILWQGSPDWRVLARTAFHTRIVAGYFAVLAIWAAISAVVAPTENPGALTGVAMTLLVGGLVVGLLHLLAWGSARTTVYTLTNRRIVMRIGMAVPKCINLPLGKVQAAELAVRADGTGDIPLTIAGPARLGYAALWPHARPVRIVRPQPMLRSIPQAEQVAGLIARTLLAANPDGQAAAVAPAAPLAVPAPAFAGAVAA